MMFLQPFALIFAAIILIVASTADSALVTSEKDTAANFGYNTSLANDFDYGFDTTVRFDPNANLARWIQAIQATGGSLTVTPGTDPRRPARRIEARITRRSLAVGRAHTGFTVPDFAEFQRRTGNRGARCHLIARSLGGAGNVPMNFFPGWQNRFNTPVMRDCEGIVRRRFDRTDGGLIRVRYAVETVNGNDPWPRAVRIRATVEGEGNDLFHVQIENTASAPFTNL